MWFLPNSLILPGESALEEAFVKGLIIGEMKSWSLYISLPRLPAARLFRSPSIINM